MINKYTERRKECKTDTQHIVNLSGYIWTVECLDNIRNYLILDVACGSGYGSYYLAKKSLRVIGIDKSDETIKFCKNKYKRYNLDFLTMDCTNLKFPDSYFDAVISQDTIEHVKEDDAFLYEVKRVLKPNGTLIVITPHSRIHCEDPENPFHIREYSKESFLELLRKYFSEIRLYGRKLGPKLENLERDLDKIRTYDKLYIRMIIPRKIRHLIANMISKIKGNILLSEVSCKDIMFTENLDESITLIAVCKK